MPLGGERTVVRELRNVHPELTADDMEENARQLHIRRELPAHTHIIEWPWADMTSLNWAMENNKYDDARFRFGTNATGKLTLTTGFDLSEQAQPNREKQYTSAQGYKLFETTFSDLPKIALTPDSENDEPVFYKLRFTGRTANAEETANENVDEARIYYTGTQMNVPLRNMKTGQYYLSSGAHTLKLDFSNSYFNRVKVRVKTVLVNTDATQDGVDDYLAVLNNPDPALAKEKLLYPTSNWDKGVEFLSDGSSKTIEVPLEENNHKNMMYKVVVEYCRHKGGGVYDEGNWLEIADTKIYQDGKPCDGSDVIWKYSAQDWGWSQMGVYNTGQNPSRGGQTLVEGALGLKWQEPTPYFGTVSGTYSGWKTSFTAGKNAKSVFQAVTGPDAVTARRRTRTAADENYVLILYGNYGFGRSENRYWFEVKFPPGLTGIAQSTDPTKVPELETRIHVWNAHYGILDAGWDKSYCEFRLTLGNMSGYIQQPIKWPYFGKRNWTFIGVVQKIHTAYSGVTTWNELNKQVYYYENTNTGGGVELYLVNGFIQKRTRYQSAGLETGYTEIIPGTVYTADTQQLEGTQPNAVFRTQISSTTTDEVFPQE